MTATMPSLEQFKQMTRATWAAGDFGAVARNDLRLCMTDDDTDVAPLPCPIHVLGGSDDERASHTAIGALIAGCGS